MTELKIETLHTIDTGYSADSAEWCPINGLEDYFVCGTYQLEDNSNETKARRKGKLMLFKYDVDKDYLREVQVVPTEAILDQKWHKKQPLLAMVNSVGDVQIYELSHEVEEKIELKSKINVDSTDDNLLTLALDWSNDMKNIVTSDSKGNLSILDVADGGLTILKRFKAHSFEAWTCAISKTDNNIIYSGIESI